MCMGIVQLGENATDDIGERRIVFRSKRHRPIE